MIQTFRRAPKQSLQLAKIDQHPGMRPVPARYDPNLNLVVMTMQVLALPVIIPQSVGSSKRVLHANFKTSKNLSTSEISVVKP